MFPNMKFTSEKSLIGLTAGVFIADRQQLISINENLSISITAIDNKYMILLQILATQIQYSIQIIEIC